MDLVKLLGTLDTIGSKQTLSEAEDRPASAKKETTWKDKSGKEHSAQKVQGWQSRKADKEADKEKELDEGKKPDFLDMDKDGDKKEPMSKAIKDKKSKVKESSFSDLLKALDAIVENEQVDEEKVDEDDVEEGNEFSGELAKAKASGKTEFEVDGKTYPVKEDQDLSEVSVPVDKYATKQAAADFHLEVEYSMPSVRSLQSQVRTTYYDETPSGAINFHIPYQSDSDWQDIRNIFRRMIWPLRQKKGWYVTQPVRGDMGENKNGPIYSYEFSMYKPQSANESMTGLGENKDRQPAKEKETTWKDKSGKEHPAKQVQGWQSRRADKEAEDETAKTMKESAQLDECGMGPESYSQQDQSGMTVNTNIDTRTGHKSVSVTAEGDAADELMQILKLSGMSGGEKMGDVDGDGDHDMADHAAELKGKVQVVAMGDDVPLAQQDGGYKMGEMQEEYANEPAPAVQPVDTQLRQGTDLNKEKTMVKHNYRGGDNPYAMKEAQDLANLEAELFEELQAIKLVK